MAREGMSHESGDADEMARVAALVARAGLRLPANEIAGLVTAYRSDRAGFERLRSLVAAEDETAHRFRVVHGDRDA
ncbi:MAG: hypothetical protein U0893_02065 [Chloroflexota bacterium]